jgi:hypothetical protein
VHHIGSDATAHIHDQRSLAEVPARRNDHRTKLHTGVLERSVKGVSWPRFVHDRRDRYPMALTVLAKGERLDDGFQASSLSGREDMEDHHPQTAGAMAWSGAAHLTGLTGE